MKKLPIAAAALLFGTSAFAMVPSAQPAGTWAQKDPDTVQPAPPVDDGAPALQPAAVDSWTTADTTDDADAAAWADAAAAKDARVAMADETGDTMTPEPAAAVADQPQVETAAYTTGFDSTDDATVETAALTDSGDAIAAVETASADLAPRPAAENYPACRPGPGDDRCIQLYEPGVRAELASWTQPTGGFADRADTQVAMGGPYEPVDSATETERLNQQALAASSTAVQTASADDTGMAADAQPVDDSATETAMADDQGSLTTDGEPSDEDVGEV